MPARSILQSRKGCFDPPGRHGNLGTGWAVGGRNSLKHRFSFRCEATEDRQDLPPQLAKRPRLNLVGMQFRNDRGHRGSAVAPHLGLTNPFRGALDGPLPTIGALHRTGDMHACSQPLLDECSGNLPCLGLRLGGRGNLAKFTCRQSRSHSGFRPTTPWMVSCAIASDLDNMDYP